MKVTGFQIREAINRWTRRRNVADTQFRESLWAFEGEEKDTPKDVIDRYMEADKIIVALQMLQTVFNLHTLVSVRGQEIPLGKAVRLLGGAGRVEKIWREAATDSAGDRYYDRNERSRGKDNEYAKRQVSIPEATRLSDEAAAFASELRAAVATGNMATIETDLPDSVFS